MIFYKSFKLSDLFYCRFNALATQDALGRCYARSTYKIQRNTKITCCLQSPELCCEGLARQAVIFSKDPRRSPATLPRLGCRSTNPCTSRGCEHKKG